MASVETEEDEGPEVSLNDILETSISNFTAVWRSISNYTHFREEARQLIERLRFTFTPNGKREFVPRDQVFPLFFVYCLLLLHKNK